MKNNISQTTPNEQQPICQSGPQQAENQSRSTKKKRSAVMSEVGTVNAYRYQLARFNINALRHWTFFSNQHKWSNAI